MCHAALILKDYDGINLIPVPLGRNTRWASFPDKLIAVENFVWHELLLTDNHGPLLLHPLPLPDQFNPTSLIKYC